MMAVCEEIKNEEFNLYGYVCGWECFVCLMHNEKGWVGEREMEWEGLSSLYLINNLHYCWIMGRCKWNGYRIRKSLEYSTPRKVEFLGCWIKIWKTGSSKSGVNLAWLMTAFSYIILFVAYINHIYQK